MWSSSGLTLRKNNMSEPSPEVAADRERIYEIVQCLMWGLTQQALAQALKAIRDGRTRGDLVALGAPWRLGPNGAAHQP